MGLLYNAYNKIPTARKRNVLPQSWYLSTDMRSVTSNQTVIVTATTREGPVSKRIPVFRVSFLSISFSKVHRKFHTISKLQASRLREGEFICLYLYSHHYSLLQNFKKKNTGLLHFCHFHSNTGGRNTAYTLIVYKTGEKKLALLPSLEQN